MTRLPRTASDIAGLARTLPWLVVVAHPDDETLGCGALLPTIEDLTLVHATDGAPADGTDARRAGFEGPEAYAAARRAETDAALGAAGVRSAVRLRFGLPDQGLVHHLANLADRLRPLVARAGVVLTHAFEGGHPDHDALAYAVQRAAEALPRTQRPLRLELPLYHAGAEGWIRQEALPHPGAGPLIERRLEADDLARKRAMAAAYRSQADTLAGFDLTREILRAAPDYDFEILPNGGRLLAEIMGWGLDGAGWRAAVAAADASLRAAAEAGLPA